MIPTCYLIVRGSKLTTRSTEPRLDGGIANLVNADASDEDIRGDMAIVLRVNPFRPARMVLLRVLKGGLLDEVEPGPKPNAA